MNYLKVNTGEILDIITETNRFMKSNPENGILKRGAYYSLKDKIIKDLLVQGLVDYELDRVEYFTDVKGNYHYVVALTLKKGEHVCRIHQELDHFYRDFFDINIQGVKTKPYVNNKNFVAPKFNDSSKELSVISYVPETYDGFEPIDSDKFVEDIDFLRKVKVGLYRITMTQSCFDAMINQLLDIPDHWIRNYTKIRIKFV